MIELKPCPWCGKNGQYHLIRTSIDDYKGRVTFVFDVTCKDCKARAPYSEGELTVAFTAKGELTVMHDDRQKAAERWNTREACNDSYS